MSHSRVIRSAALALALGALSAPVAAAVPAERQDLRSPDARDAALSAAARQDLRSPDARDAAEGRGTFSAPEVTVVKLTEPSPSSGGLDWGDAGIGAGALLGVILVGVGGTLAVVHRRHGGVARRQAATTG